MIVIDRHDGNIFAEAVDQYADHIVMGLHGDTDLFAAVHAEQTPGVAGQVKCLKFRPAKAAVPCEGDLQHFVDTIVLDLGLFRVEADEIVVLIIPHQAPGTDLIPTSVFTQFHLFFDIPAVVLKADPPVSADGIMKLVYIIVDALIHGLDPAGDGDLSLQLGRLIFADKGLEFFDQSL